MRRAIKESLKENRAFRNIVISILALVLGVIGLESYAPGLYTEIERVLGENRPGLYQVTAVHDGDTISVFTGETEERVRLIGIDTPEKNHPEKPIQCFAEAASIRLSELIDGQKVELIADPASDNRDIYDRLLRYVYHDDGEFINKTMVEEGYAFAYTAFPFRYLDEFRLAEKYAQFNELGLWSSCDVELQSQTLQTSWP